MEGGQEDQAVALNQEEAEVVVDQILVEEVEAVVQILVEVVEAVVQILVEVGEVVVGKNLVEVVVVEVQHYHQVEEEVAAVVGQAVKGIYNN